MIEYRCPIGNQGIYAMQRASLKKLDSNDIRRGRHYDYAKFDASQIEFLGGSVYINGDRSHDYRYSDAKNFRKERGIKEIYFDGFHVVFVGGISEPFGSDLCQETNIVESLFDMLGL